MILLDTCVWLWWMSEPERLTPRARAAIDAATGAEGLRVSAISAWEVAIKAASGKLVLRWPAPEFVARAAALPIFQFVPISYEIALASTALEPIHRDPADRFIVATAKSMGIPLVTSDEKIPLYQGLRVVW